MNEHSIIKEDIKVNIRLQIYRVEQQISATPTGQIRNALCDANIHLRAAIEALELTDDK